MTLGAGCSDTADVATPSEPEDTAPRPPSAMPTPWITAVEPHQGFNDEPVLAVTPSGDVFVAWISYRDGADSLVIASYSHEGDRFVRQGEIQPRIQRLCYRNVARPQLNIDLTAQLS